MKHFVGTLPLTNCIGAGSKFRKAEWYDILQGGRKFDLFGEQDVTLHASQRRLVSRIYAMETLKDLEPYVNETVGHFVAKLEQMLSTEPATDVDLGKWLQLFAFGMSMEMSNPMYMHH